MKKSRFTETQIIKILNEGEAGSKVKDTCRAHGISDATYYYWKSKYGGMQTSDLKRMKDMEHELSQLKRIYADMALENRAMKDRRPAYMRQFYFLLQSTSFRFLEVVLVWAYRGRRIIGFHKSDLMKMSLIL